MMGAKVYVVVSTRYVKGIERWMGTLSKNMENITPVIIMYKPHFKVIIRGALFYKQDIDYPGNIERYYPLIDLIKYHKGEDDWWLWTDGADVVFQDKIDFKDIPTNIEVLSCSEGEKHKDNEFWKMRLSKEDMELLGELNIRNAGLFAMKGSKLIEWINFLKEKNVGANDDQAVYNKFLLLNKDKVMDYEPFLCLGNRYLNEAGLKKGEFINKNNFNKYQVIHANGNTKDVLDVVYLLEDYGTANL